MPRRTPEELIAHREEQNRKARLRLARARDPRIEEIEAIMHGLEHQWLNAMADKIDSDFNVAGARDTLRQVHAALVEEALKS